MSTMLDLDAPENVQDLLSSVLSEGGVTPARLFESLYYAADEHVFSIMRVIAALELEDRAKVLTYAQQLMGAQRLAALSFGQPCARQ